MEPSASRLMPSIEEIDETATTASDEGAGAPSLQPPDLTLPGSWAQETEQGASLPELASSPTVQCATVAPQRREPPPWDETLYVPIQTGPFVPSTGQSPIYAGLPPDGYLDDLRQEEAEARANQRKAKSFDKASRKRGCDRSDIESTLFHDEPAAWPKGVTATPHSRTATVPSRVAGLAEETAPDPRGHFRVPQPQLPPFSQPQPQQQPPPPQQQQPYTGGTTSRQRPISSFEPMAGVPGASAAERLRQRDERWPGSGRTGGMLFEGSRSVPVDPNLDPPHHACFNCWERGHTRSQCPKPRTRFCFNCGRRGVDLNCCPRCSEEHQRYLRNQQRLPGVERPGYSIPEDPRGRGRGRPQPDDPRPRSRGRQEGRRQLPSPTREQGSARSSRSSSARSSEVVYLAEITRDLSPATRRGLLHAFLEERKAEK